MNLSAIRCPSSRRPFSHNTVRSLRGGFEEQFRNGVRIVGNGGGEPEVEAQLRNYPRLGYTVIALINQEGANHPSIDTMLDITESSGPGESGTRWRPAALVEMQATMLLGAASLGVFKPGRRARQPKGGHGD
jgi:hypothetical protein